MSILKLDVNKIKQLVTKGVSEPEDHMQVIIIFKDDSRYAFEPMTEDKAISLHNSILKKIEDEIFKAERLSFTQKLNALK